MIHFLFFNKNVVFLFLFLFLLGNLNCVGAGADAAGGEVMFTRRTFGAFGATLASDDRFIAELERLWCTLEQPTRDGAVRRKVNKYFSL